MPGTELDDTLSIDPDRADAELSGTGYRFVRAIARSEGGVVWEVEHVNLAVRHVMKLLAARLSDDPRLLDRFRVEAQVMARLAHDNLLRVTDFGWTAQGRPYLVSELLIGRTLAELVAERGVLPIGPAVELVRQALLGLGEAHRAGLVHRDVTLQNLFLCDTNAQGERLLKVMDFGLAKVLLPPGPIPSYAPVLSTATGGLVLGRAALSPEQADGRTVDARTDIYCVGVALYELLAGRGPFASATEAELVVAHARSAPQPPSAVAPQPIPPALDALVLKALAKDPAERFASADEMAEVLDQYASALARPGGGVEVAEASGATARGDDRSGGADVCAPSGGERGAVGGERGAVGGERGAVGGERGAVGGERGAVGGERSPGGAGRRPSGGGRERLGAGRGPSGGGRRPSAPADSAIFRPGALCGGDRYRIVELISCGGFAEIYAARDVRDEAPRAIKVLQARHQANERAMGRLLREARAGVSLVHPNLVRVYDAGIDLGSGALYVAMELLEGHTLRDLLIAHRQMEPLVALQWAAELADAVHVLNELGIIHRDLKPENIFVTVDGVLKVLDLGNIRLERVGLKTTRGPITGTALYMSPEHIRGEAVDRRADVYALALITYECLAGIHPLLVGASVMPTMMEITSWQLLKEIEPLTTLLPKLPSALWRALKQALHKEREERLASAAELAIHLRAVQDAMATAQGARARVPAMTVAVVRSTGAHPQAQPLGRVAPPPVAPLLGPQSEPSSPPRGAASAVTDRGTQVIEPSSWAAESAARDARAAHRAPSARAAAAVPVPGQARHAATASSAATLRLVRPPAGAPRAAAVAAPSQPAGPAPLPRWLLPLGALVAFTVALAVTLWLASSSGAQGSADPRASARSGASTPLGAGAPGPARSAGGPDDRARDGGAVPAIGPAPKPLPE